MNNLTPDQERECLSYDPFAGDDDPDTKIFSDRMVTAAKDQPQGACCICFGCIAKGERHRVQKARNDGTFKNCRMCAACCLAMAQSWEDAGDAIELRTELGMRRAGATGYGTPQPNLTEAEFFAVKEHRATETHAQNITLNAERRGEANMAANERTANNSARTAAALERMAAALDDLSAPSHHISVKWLVAALAVLAAVGLLYRFIAAQYAG